MRATNNPQTCDHRWKVIHPRTPWQWCPRCGRFKKFFTTLPFALEQVTREWQWTHKGHFPDAEAALVEALDFSIWKWMETHDGDKAVATGCSVLRALCDEVLDCPAWGSK